MSYAVAQDMIDRFGQEELVELTDRANTGAIDMTVLARALADADAEINSYLSSRYALPLASVPAELVPKACDLARYFLYDTRVNERVKDRHDDVIKWLQALAKGLVSLGLDPVDVPVPDAAGVQFTANARVFGADLLADY
jgi:phage gp36-like protein